MVMQGADLATSMYAAGRGGFRERNPLLRPPLQDHPVAFATVKMGLSAVVIYSLMRLHYKKPHLALGLAIAGAVAFGAVAVSNSHVIR